MPSGPKKRRALRRKRPGDADYEGEENEGIESTTAIKAVAVTLVERVEQALSSNGVIHVDNVCSKDVNEGKKFAHGVVDSSIGEDKVKEPYDQGVLGLGPNNKRDHHLPVKVKDHIKSSSIKVGDGLGFIAAIALKESAQPLNKPSEENNPELGIKGNVVDSGIGKDEGQVLHQVLESGPNNEASHMVEESYHTESALINEETGLVLKAATNIEFARKPEDALLSKELTFVGSAHSDDVLQLDSEENVGKKFVNNFVDSSPEENTSKESREAILGSGHNEADSHFMERNGHIEFASIKADDCLVPKATATVELVEPIDGLVVGVVVDTLHSQEIFELGSKENEGKELLEDDVYSSVTEDRGKEMPEQVPESDPNSEIHSHILKGNDQIESASITAYDNLVLEATDVVQVAEPINALSVKRVVVDNLGSENALELSSREDAGKFINDIVDSSRGEEKISEEPQEAALDSLPNRKTDSQLTTVALEVAEPNIDALSSGVVVDKDGPAEVLGLGTKENEGKDFPEDDVDSSLGEERARELPETVLNSDPNYETYSHLMKGNEQIESTSIKADDNLVLEATDVVQVAEPITALSAKGVVVVNLGSEDALELSSREDAGKFIDDIVDSSLGEEESSEEPQEAALDSLPNGRPDSQLTAVALELAEPNVDALSSGVVVDKDGPAELLGLGTKENEGKDFPEEDVDSSLGEERARELPENLLNSDPNTETYSHLRVLLLVCIGFLLLVCLSSYTVSMIMWCGNQDDSFRVQLECARESVVAAFFIKPGSTAVELAALVGGLSSKGVVVDNARYEDVVAFGSKENQEEFLEDAAESSIVKHKGKEPPDEILDLGPNDEKDPRLMEGNDCVESAPIKDDDLGLRAFAAFDLTDLDDALSPKDVDNMDSKDAHKFGSKENEGNKFLEDVPDLSLGEDKFKEHPEVEEFFDWSLNNEMDPDLSTFVEGNDSIESAMIKADVELSLKAIGADDLTDLVDAFSSKDVDDVDIIGSKDVLEFDSKDNEGNKFLEDVADSSLGEEKCKEHPEELLDSCLNNKIDPHLIEKNDYIEPAAIINADNSKDLKDVAAVGLLEPIDDLSSEVLFVNDNVRPKDVLDLATNNETDPSLMDGNDHILSTKDGDGLVYKEDVELAEPVDDISSKGVVVAIVGYRDVLELDPVENNQGEEFLEDATDSSLLKVKSKELPEDVLDSVEGKEHIDDDLVVKDVADFNLVGPVDDLSPKGIVGDNVGSEDALELGSNKNEGEFLNDVADSSLAEDEGKELPEEMLDSGPNNDEYPHLRIVGDTLGSDSEDALELGSNKNEEEFLKDVTDTSLEEDKGKEPYEEVLDSGPYNKSYPHLKVHALEIDEDLVCENATATTLVEPADTLSPEWVLVNHDDILDLGTKDCDGKEFIEETVGSSLEEDECKEPPKKVCGTVPTKNDGKPVLLEDPSNNELELGSISKENDTTELAPADVETTSASRSIVVEANLEENGSKLPKRVVQDAFIEDIYARKHYQIDGEDILELLEAVKKTVEEQIVVVEDMRVNLREMMAKLNSIRTLVRT